MSISVIVCISEHASATPSHARGEPATWFQVCGLQEELFVLWMSCWYALWMVLCNGWLLCLFQTKLLVCTCVFRWNLFWFYFWARWDEWVYRICARRRKQSDLHYRTDPNLLCGRIRIKTSLAIWAENEFSYFMIFWRWGEFLRAFYWISHVCLIGITL